MIYQIGSNGYWTGASREIGDKDGAPRGWTRSPIPDLGEGEYATWGGNGWRIVGEYVAPEPPPPPVPDVVSRFQAKAALSAAGLLPAVEAALADADPLAQLAWAEAIEFRRQSPTILALATALGLTDAQLDDLFIAADQIEA
jgi:hypothetical protein